MSGAYDNEMYCPSVDVCGWCGDCECDGISCIASLEPDNPDDRDAIERLHGWLRRGQLLEQMERHLAVRENRSLPPSPGGPHDELRTVWIAARDFIDRGGDEFAWQELAHAVESYREVYEPPSPGGET